jgi:hypothetical protein
MDLVWRILPTVRPRERERFAFFLGLGGALALAQTVGLTAAESVFLSRVGAAALPVTFVLASGITTAASFLYAIRVGQARNDDVLIELLAVAVLLSAGVGVAMWLQAPYAPTALLCLQIGAQAILLNHFAELAGDCFDRLASKRVTPLFTAGLSLGAAGGGALAVGLSRTLPAEALVAAWGLLLLGILLWMRLSRTRIRRWAPLGLEEDARSLEGARAAARYLQRSPLGRLLVISAVLMVATATVTRVLYSGTFENAFPDERALASFLGTYLAVTNLVQVVIPLWIVPALIARIGVPSANLIHPTLSFVTSIGLALSQQLPTALLARVNAEVLENALAAPVRNLVYEALPARLSARAGAFLGGVVIQAALSLAGGALLLASGFAPAMLALFGAALALAYLLGHLRLRRAYVVSLVEELRSGRLDLGAIGSELGRGEASRLAGLWQQLVQTPDEGALRTLVELAPFLAARGFDRPLLDALHHPVARLRAACLRALAQGNGAEARIPPGVLVEALGDADPSVCLAALGALPADAAARDVFVLPLRTLQHDPLPAVAAGAASRLGPAGETVLRAMLRSADAAHVVAAMDALPEALAPEARANLEDREPRVRAAVLDCAARHPAALSLRLPELLGALRDPNVHVRSGAVRALSAAPDPAAAEALASALGDVSAAVRSATVKALVARGADGARAARERLRPEEPHLARETALEVLYRIGTRDARSVVTVELRSSVRNSWEALLALRTLPEEGPLSLRWLRAAESDALASTIRLTFRILSLLEDATVTRTVERTIRHGPERLRYEALEVLSHLGDRDAAANLVLLLEPTPLEEKLSHLPAAVRRPGSVEDVVASAREGPTRWLRWAARAASGTENDSSKEGLMERLVFLRGVALFSNLSLEQLEAIEAITREEPYVEGEHVVREGDPGDHLYLVMEGEVSVWRGQGGESAHRLNTLGPGSYFGEMSILDHQPRSATVITTCESRLLVLDGDRLRELILEQPEIVFEMFRMLTARVRAAEARLPG